MASAFEHFSYAAKERLESMQTATKGVEGKQ